MDVKNAILKRRAYRSLLPFKVTSEIINELGTAAQLMPSCFNKQPWRYVFIYKDTQLEILKKEVINTGNAWAHNSPLIVAIFSKPDLDCIIGERVFNLFDTGMATGAIILRATEMELVAHPIAGFDPKKAAEILGIPSEYQVLALLIFGKKNPELDPILNEYQIQSETKRPDRKSLEEFVFHNHFS
jgi:nitroreductase